MFQEKDFQESRIDNLEDRKKMNQSKARLSLVLMFDDTSIDTTSVKTFGIGIAIFVLDTTALDKSRSIRKP